ncbi:MAG: sterol desaturase family protein [Parvularculaceae bacterium]
MRSYLTWYVRYLFAPTLMFVPLIAVGNVIFAGGPNWLVAPTIFAAALVVLTVERFAPHQPSWNGDHGERARDLAYMATLVALILTSAAISRALPKPDLWPTDWPVWLQFALVIVIADAGFTIARIVSHRWPLMWRFHEPHHAPHRLYGLNGMIKHPVNVGAEAAAGLSPLWLLGAPHEATAVLGLAVGLQLLLQHANLDLRTPGPLSFWAIAPVHRRHHYADAVEGDVNFGLFTTV